MAGAGTLGTIAASGTPGAGDALPPWVLRPPHAYVPGQNDRHPEAFFDAVKADAEAGHLPPARLHETRAFKTGRAYLAAGYYWECHEVLEAVWMQTPVPSPERHMMQALIQLANARLKLRMDRPRAAHRLCAMVRDHLQNCPADRAILGLTRAEVLSEVAQTEATLPPL